MKKTSSGILVLAGLTFSMSLFLAGCQTDTGVKAPTYDDGYKEGYKDARQSVTELGILVNQPSTVLTGTVESVGANSLTMKAKGLVLDERVDGIGPERTVTVSADTRILSLTEKDQATFFEEQEAFNRELAGFDPVENGEPPVPPSPYTEKEVSLSDIRVGDSITVESAEDDLVPLKSFTATKINIIPAPQKEAPITTIEGTPESESLTGVNMEEPAPVTEPALQ